MVTNVVADLKPTGKLRRLGVKLLAKRQYTIYLDLVQIQVIGSRRWLNAQVRSSPFSVVPFCPRSVVIVIANNGAPTSSRCKLLWVQQFLALLRLVLLFT
jgi:hypothetical protein